MVKPVVKSVAVYIKSQIESGNASPASLGSTLGPAGINIMEFCKAFNEYTKDMAKGIPVPVIITVYKDKKFSFVTKKPPVSYYLKNAISLSKGSSTPGRENVGTISKLEIEKIAQEKMEDLNTHSLVSACAMIMGSARSMGIEIE